MKHIIIILVLVLPCLPQNTIERIQEEWRQRREYNKGVQRLKDEGRLIQKPEGSSDPEDTQRAAGSGEGTTPIGGHDREDQEADANFYSLHGGTVWDKINKAREPRWAKILKQTWAIIWYPFVMPYEMFEAWQSWFMWKMYPVSESPQAVGANATQMVLSIGKYNLGPFVVLFYFILIIPILSIYRYAYYIFCGLLFLICVPVFIFECIRWVFAWPVRWICEATDWLEPEWVEDALDPDEPDDK